MYLNDFQKGKKIMNKFEIFKTQKISDCKELQPKQSRVYIPNLQNQNSSRQSNSLYDHLQNYSEKQNKIHYNQINNKKQDKNNILAQKVQSYNDLFNQKRLNKNYQNSFSTQDSQLKSKGFLSKKNSNESQSQDTDNMNITKYSNNKYKHDSIQQLIEGQYWLQNYDLRNIDISLSDKQIEYFQNLEKKYEDDDAKKNDQYAQDVLIELEKENRVLKMILENENNKQKNSTKNYQNQQYILKQQQKIAELTNKKQNLNKLIKDLCLNGGNIDMSLVLDQIAQKEGQRLQFLIDRKDQNQITDTLNSYLESLKKEILIHQIENENLKMTVEDNENNNQDMILCYNKIQEMSQQNQDYAKKIQYFKNIIQNDQKLQDIYKKQLKIQQLRSNLQFTNSQNI